MRTIITRKDGTVLWQSEEFDPAFWRQIVPPADHPSIVNEAEFVVTNALTIEEALAIVAAPENTRGDAGMSITSPTVDAVAPGPKPVTP